MRRTTGMLIASAAASLILSGAVVARAAGEKSGDTVHCATEVISKRESTSRPGAGIIEFQHRAYNQNNKLVAECRRQVFMRMRPT